MKKSSPQKKKVALPELPKRFERELATVESVQPAEEMVTRIKHSVNLGDLIAAMGAIKEYNRVVKRRVVMAQTIGTLAQYYQGATHPTKDENGANVCMNKSMFDMVKPLIESQPYIHSMEAYTGQEIHFDFDIIRGKTFVNLPNGMIQAWIFYAFPDLSFDLSEPWITIEGKCPKHIESQAKGKIILNFTERYRGAVNLEYFYLKNYQDELVFAGTDKEHFLFCNAWQLNIPRLEVNDFLEYAYAIRESRFFLGNQSFGWNLAEAMKTPRILEVCSFAANCQPNIGKMSVGYFHQGANEYYFRTFYNKTNK